MLTAESSLLRPRMRLVVHRQHVLHGELGVALCSRQSFMTKHLLDSTKIGAFFQHMCPEGMTQSVRVDVRRKPLRDRDLFNNASDASGRQTASALIDKQRPHLQILSGMR